MKFFSKILAPSIFLFSIMCARDLRMGEKAVAPWKGRDWVIYVDRITKQNFFNPATDKIIVENKGVKNDAATYAAYTKMYNAYPVLEHEFNPTFLQNVIKTVDVPPASTTYPVLPFPPPSLSSSGAAGIGVGSGVTSGGMGTSSTAGLGGGAGPASTPSGTGASTGGVGLGGVGSATGSTSSAAMSSGTSTSAGSGAGGGGTGSSVVPSPSAFTPSAPSGISIIKKGSGPAVAALITEQMVKEERDSLSGLSAQEKQKSDQAFFDAMAEIAGECFVTTGKKNGLLQYLEFIGARLKTLHANPDYKFKKSLAYHFFNNGDVNVASNKIAASLASSVFGKTIETNFNFLPSAEEFLTKIYNDETAFNGLKKSLFAVLEPNIFDVSLRKLAMGDQTTHAALSESLDLFAVNIIVCQRPTEDVNTGLSDGEAQELLGKFKNINSDDDLKKFAYALNKLRLHPDFYRFSFLLGSQNFVDNASKHELEKIKWYPLLQMLRVDSYPKIPGKSLQESTNAVADILKQKNFAAALQNQLFFIPTNYDSVTVALSNVVASQRLAYLSSLVPAVASGSIFLFAPLSKAVTVKAIIQALNSIKNAVAADKKSLLDPIITELQQPLPTNVVVQAHLKTAMDELSSAVPEEDRQAVTTHVVNVVEDFTKKNLGQAAVKSALKAVVGKAENPQLADDFIERPRHGRTGITRAVASEVTNKLHDKDLYKKLLEGKVSGQIMREFQSIFATPQSIYEALSSFFGGKNALKDEIKAYLQNTNARFSEADAENVIARIIQPYGMVMRILKDANIKISTTDRAEIVLQRLIAELNGLFDAKKPAIKTNHVFDSPVNGAAVDIGLYKNSPILTALINALKTDDVEHVLENAKKLVDQSSLDPEEEKKLAGEKVFDQKERQQEADWQTVKDNLIWLIMQSIAEPLELINNNKDVYPGSGARTEVALPGLERNSGGRINKENVKAYASMKGAFTDLLPSFKDLEAFKDISIGDLQKKVDEAVDKVPAIAQKPVAQVLARLVKLRSFLPDASPAVSGGVPMAPPPPII